MMVLTEEKRDIFERKILVCELFEHELISLQATARNSLESFFTEFTNLNNLQNWTFVR